MKVRITRSCKRGIRFVGIAVIAALVPLPVIADTAAKRPPTIKESAAQIVARDVSAVPIRPAVREARQGNPPTSSTSFFKTRPGMIALAVMAVGTGYALYSAHNDRNRSPGRQ
jgi:hypothetical protein